MRYGLIGAKLGHSYSPELHSFLSGGTIHYEKIELSAAELPAFFEERDFCGVNVTIPYKRTVIPFLDALSPIAQRIGSVNTVVQRDGMLWGTNTDYDGFLQMTMHAGVSFHAKNVMILGNGGTALTARAVIQDQGAHQMVTVSRHDGDLDFESLSASRAARETEILVNTTPVGMFPDGGNCPVSLDDFPNLCAVLDVVYNPLRTCLVQTANAKGLRTGSGLMMLAAQAQAASDLFLVRESGDTRAVEAFEFLHQRLENLVLIGMPGSGKTVIGTALADQLNRCFIDIDAEIVKEIGEPIPPFLLREGEERFRDVESGVIARVANQTGAVIATGGGAVLRERNCRLLRMNGYVVRLTRQLSQLSTENRPLSQNLQELAQRREAFYQSCADQSVENWGAVEQTVQKILGIGRWK